MKQVTPGAKWQKYMKNTPPPTHTQYIAKYNKYPGQEYYTEGLVLKGLF